MQDIQNDVIKCCKMMSSNVVLLHSNNCCVVLEPAICEDLDLHVAIFYLRGKIRRGDDGHVLGDQVLRGVEK